MNPTRIARDGERAAKPWIIRLARIGIAAKGLVYITVGVLALQVAAGTRTATPNTETAIATLAGQPFGTVLISMVAGGLFGYVLWRLIQAVVDPDRAGAMQRIGSVVSGIIYGGFAVFAFEFIRGRASSGGHLEKNWTAKVLAAPLGEWWVYLIALLILAYAGHEAYQAWSADFRKDWKTGQMGATETLWATRAGRAGYAARAVVFAVAGAFLFSAASRRDPNQAQGLDGALAKLASQHYGEVLLACVAAGLACYGISQFIEARYLRMRA